MIVADQPRCSTEAQEALRRAQRAHQSNDAVLPAAHQLRDRVREVLAENHFAELMRRALEAAARR